MKKLKEGSVSRARWAAVGAAVAVSLGVGGVAVTNAVVSTGERTAFIPISPCRLFDTRPAPAQVGPRSAPLGPHEIYAVQVTGTNGNCTIPSDASAVAMNVTTVGGTAPSYLTLWPSDVAQPLASNLNWVPGSPPTPEQGRREVVGHRPDQPVQRRRCGQRPGRRGRLLRRPQPRRPLLHQDRGGLEVHADIVASRQVRH